MHGCIIVEPGAQGLKQPIESAADAPD